MEIPNKSADTPVGYDTSHISKKKMSLKRDQKEWRKCIRNQSQPKTDKLIHKN